MTSPIYMKVIQNDMADAMGLVLVIGTLVQIVGNLSETILIGVIRIAALAGINVLMFIFVYIGVLLIRKNMESFEAQMVMNRTFKPLI